MFRSTPTTFPRTLRRGSRGDDVQRLQAMLGTAGHDPEESDANYGSLTEIAVRSFQRASNLVPNGVAGPQTIAALTDFGRNHTKRAIGATGLSLHIGLNRVDPGMYPFPVPPLSGCVNDANDMRDLAMSMGFRQKVLTNEAATSAAVLGAIGKAAQTLASGDLFLITYSGHGSQMPDATGEETDGMDETWVLWDRQLLDDELYGLWGEFAPDVRIVIISDSCHSGTVTRALDLAVEGVVAGYERKPSPGRGMANGGSAAPGRDAAGVALALRELVDPVFNELPASRGTAAALATERVIRNTIEGLGDPVATTPRRLLPEFARHDLVSRLAVYRDAKIAAQRSPFPRCKVMLISGCQDNQTSSDGAPSAHQNGAFTRALLSIWQGATNYSDLHSRVAQLLPPTQSPNLYWATSRDAAFEGQRPFLI